MFIIFSFQNVCTELSNRTKRKESFHTTGCSWNILFFQEFSKVCHVWMYKNYQQIGVTVNSHCIESFAFTDIKRGRGSSEFWKKTTIFPEHPLVAVLRMLTIKKKRSELLLIYRVSHKRRPIAKIFKVDNSTIWPSISLLRRLGIFFNFDKRASFKYSSNFFGIFN